MDKVRADIIAQLKKDVLFQRFSKIHNNLHVASGNLHPFASAFPLNQFPLGCVHEFICPGRESFSASAAFVAGTLSSLHLNKGSIIWVSNTKEMFPPAFTSFGLSPHQVLFIHLTKQKDILYAAEEALRCEGLSAVIADLRELSFKQSRRLQLATEQSNVTGFVLRNKPKFINTTACVTRWNITPAISTSYQNIPGIGFPAWNVHLQKVRNGTPQSWKVSWRGGRFMHEHEQLNTITIHQKKAV